MLHGLPMEEMEKQLLGQLKKVRGLLSHMERRELLD